MFSVLFARFLTAFLAQHSCATRHPRLLFWAAPDGRTPCAPRFACLRFTSDCSAFASCSHLRMPILTRRVLARHPGVRVFETDLDDREDDSFLARSTRDSSPTQARRMQRCIKTQEGGRRGELMLVYLPVTFAAASVAAILMTSVFVRVATQSD